jgi:hypothetical protein
MSRRAVPRKPEVLDAGCGERGGTVRRVLTRDLLDRVLRARWLFAVVVLALVLGTIVVTQGRRLALAADTRGATEAVSVDNTGAIRNDSSNQPSISATGRFVAFTTFAPYDPIDLQNDEGGDPDIYVRDTVAHTTTYISSSRDDGDPVASDGSNGQPSISGTGRYVAFVTADRGILGIPASTEFVNPTVVICDRGAPNASGAFDHLCTYTTFSGSDSIFSQATPSISADGRTVAFLQDNDRVRVANLAMDGTGAITAVSFSDPPVPAPVLLRSGHDDWAVALSGNGRYLVRVTRYVDTGEVLPSFFTVLVNDLNTPTAPAVRMDLNGSGGFVGSGTGHQLTEPAVSGDGRRVGFTELTGGDPPMVVHAVDRDADGNGTFGPGTGLPTSADVVSRDVSGTIVGGRQPAFSGDGRYLAFVTDAAHVHNGADSTTKEVTCIHATPPPVPHPVDTGRSTCDVVARDLVLDAQRAAAGQSRLPAELASPSQLSVIQPSTGPQVTCDTVCEGNGDSVTPVLDADGSAVAYASVADDLLPAGVDTNHHLSDVFKRTFKPVPVVAPLDFGDVVIHTPATGTATVSYSGFGPLRMTAVAIGGTNAADFAVFPGQTCTGPVLHPGDTCTISIRFTPSQLNARNATLDVTTDTIVHGTGRLTGRGVPEPPPRTPLFQAAPNPLAFGLQQLFTPSVAKTVTVSNPGTGPLSISAVTLVGAAPTNFPGDYQITANTCLAAAVAPGATCTVSVSFAPQAVADRPALLQFTDNAAGSPHLVALTGTGAPPTLVASPPLARSGGVSQVTGTFFPPNKVVVVSLLNTPMQVTVTASPTGTFTVPLVVFPHTPLGKKKLQASVQGVPNPIVVTIDFLVVPGSLQPPDFAERR